MTLMTEPAHSEFEADPSKPEKTSLSQAWTLLGSFVFLAMTLLSHWALS